MSGYRNDQFYNIGGAGETFDGGKPWTERSPNRARKNWYHPDADNPRFVYPDRSVRVYNGVDKYGNPIPEVQLLKRGYIRSLSVAGEPVRKCQFQFNPQTISQDVTISENLLNFYQQDPGQFAQPMAGNTQMAFTVMFDRSMEINNPIPTTRLVDRPTTSFTRTTPGSSPGEARNPWETGSPQYVGVLRDIAALYGVIGQGVTEADVQGRLEEIQTTIKSEAAYLTEDQREDEDIEKSLANIETMMSAQLGNYGLLIPRPVRLVYSSLYMVEGYVTSTSVTLQKFNTAFVPIQAMVHITIQAQHVGFAKKDTFTTYALAKAKELTLQLDEDERAIVRESYSAVEKSLTDWKLTLLSDPDRVSLQSPMTMNELSLGVFETMALQVAPSGDDRFTEVKKLMEAGGNTQLKISANFKAWTDLSIQRLPLGRESNEPRVQYYAAAWNLNTVEEVEFFESELEGGLIGNVLNVPPPWTPINPYGGIMRFVWEINVDLINNGSQLIGRALSQTEYVEDTGAWNADLSQTLKVRWTPNGDPIAGTDIIPDYRAPEYGSSSSVGSVPVESGI